MNGLRPEIKRWIRIHDPEDLHQAMQLARDVEDEFLEENGSTQQYQPLNTSFIGGFKRSWPSGATELGKFRGEVGLGSFTPLPRPNSSTIGLL